MENVFPVCLTYISHSLGAQPSRFIQFFSIPISQLPLIKHCLPKDDETSRRLIHLGYNFFMTALGLIDQDYHSTSCRFFLALNDKGGL